MADRIKGITIEIDGQTTGLKKALGDVTSQSISIQKELTDVNRLLKFDPGNTAALAQKQELLSKQIEITSQKLQGLKNAQSQVEQQFASGKIGEEQYRSFQREIEFTEASLNKFKTSYKDAMTPPTGDISQPITQLNKNVEESNGKLNEFGNTAKIAVVGGIAAVGATIVGVGALAINLGNDYANASNTLQTQTGATAEEMETLNQAMTNVYGNNFGESMQDVADNMATVQTYLKGTGEDIQTATENAIGFKDAFGVEVPESMRSVQSLMKQFGVTSEEAFNLMVQGQQEGLNYSGELYDSINEYSPQFAKLGLDAEDMFDVFSAGSQNGAFNLDKVGDAVKELSIRVIDGSTTTQDGFNKLGLNADDMAKKFGAGGDTAKEAFFQVIEGLRNMDDPIAQSTAGVDLFGTQWEDLGPKVITNLDSMQTMFDKTTNSMQEINKVQYDTPIQALQGLGRQIETSMLLPISKNVMPALNDMVGKLQEAFSNSNVQAGISSLSDGISQMATGFADFIANVLPNLLTGLGWILENSNTIAAGIVSIGVAMETFKIVSLVVAFVEAFKKAQLVTEGLTVAQWLYNAALAPIGGIVGVIIIAVAALVAAIVYLWNTNEGFRTAIIGAWQDVSQAASTFFSGIAAFFTVTIPAAFNSMITFFTSTVPQFLTNLWATISTGFITGWNIVATFFTTTLPTFFIGLWTTISQAFTDGWNAIVNFFTVSIPSWIESIGVWFSGLPNKIAFALGETLRTIFDWGTQVITWITVTVPAWIDSIVAFFTELPGKIWTTFVAVNTQFAQWTIDVTSWIVTNVSAWITNIVAYFSQLPGQIWAWLTNVVTSITTWGGNMLAEATTAATNTYNAVINWFTQLPGGIKTWLTNCVTNITTWGTDMLTEAKTGMGKVFDGIVDTFTNLPSRMIEIGGNIVAGLKQGILDAWQGMKNWVHGLTDSFVSGFTDKDGLDVHSPSRVLRKIGNFAGKGFELGMGDTIDSISRQANNLALAAIPNVNGGSYDMGLNASGGGIGSASNLDRILSTMDSMRNEIASLKDALNLTVNLDGQKVGKLVTPVVSNNLAFNSNRKGF